MEIIPIIIIILIVSAVRSAIEAAKKRQRQQGQRPGQNDQGREVSERPKTQTGESRFPKFPDPGDVFPGFPQQEETKGSEEETSTWSETKGEHDKGSTFIDENIEKYRKRQQKKEKQEPKRRVSPVGRVSTYAPKEEHGDFVREMTSTRKELKKGIIWKEILDKPKFKQRHF